MESSVLVNLSGVFRWETSIEQGPSDSYVHLTKLQIFEVHGNVTELREIAGFFLGIL